MPEIAVNVEVYCATCGAGLCNQTSVETKRGLDAFMVEPCNKCMTREYEAGYEKGETEGYKMAEERLG